MINLLMQESVILAQNTHSRGVAQEVGHFSMSRTHSPFHAKCKELTKIKIIIIIILSFFAFDKFNLECTKLLNSHYVLSHSPVLQTVEIIPCFSRDSFHTFSIRLAHWKGNEGVRHSSTDTHP